MSYICTTVIQVNMKNIAVICDSTHSFEHYFMPDARKKIGNRKLVFVPVLSKINLQIHEFSGYIFNMPKKEVKQNILQELETMKLKEFLL